ncbi:MAG: RadC family protein [Bacteroidota bacterium]
MATKEQIVRRAKRVYPVEAGCWYFVAEDRGGKSRPILGTRDACEAVEEFWRRQPDSKQERFCVLTLDTKNHPIAWHVVSIGTVDAAIVHPREVFRPAIMDSATSVIVSHNHPSGDPEPSSHDLAITRRLIEAGKAVGIEVIDHIVAGTDCISLREQGRVEF